MTINERLTTIINGIYGGNKRSFANAVGVSATVIENLVGSRQSKPSFDVLSKISTNVNISSEWLLTGEGEMLKKNATLPSSNINTVEKISVKGNYSLQQGTSNQHISIILPENGYKKIINSTGKETTLRMSDDEMPVIESLSAENRFLKQRITDLEKIIETKDDIINMYKGLVK